MSEHIPHNTQEQLRASIMRSCKTVENAAKSCRVDLMKSLNEKTSVNYLESGDNGFSVVSSKILEEGNNYLLVGSVDTGSFSTDPKLKRNPEWFQTKIKYAKVLKNLHKKGLVKLNGFQMDETQLVYAVDALSKLDPDSPKINEDFQAMVDSFEGKINRGDFFRRVLNAVLAMERAASKIDSKYLDPEGEHFKVDSETGVPQMLPIMLVQGRAVSKDLRFTALMERSSGVAAASPIEDDEDETDDGDRDTVEEEEEDVKKDLETKYSKKFLDQANEIKDGLRVELLYMKEDGSNSYIYGKLGEHRFFVDFDVNGNSYSLSVTTEPDGRDDDFDIGGANLQAIKEKLDELSKTDANRIEQLKGDLEYFDLKNPDGKSLGIKFYELGDGERFHGVDLGENDLMVSLGTDDEGVKYRLKYGEERDLGVIKFKVSIDQTLGYTAVYLEDGTTVSLAGTKNAETLIKSVKKSQFLKQMSEAK